MNKRWKIEWRAPDPDHPGEHILRAHDYDDRDRMVSDMAALLADPANDCIHVKQYPAHEAMDYGVDLTMVHRAVREEIEHAIGPAAGLAVADDVLSNLRELGRR